ncbi:MAG: hypothetical protein KF777_09525 [Planctomycetaceae bacterium]|nr:hypothetical protein [Planctomycetaceae bacterium]
MGVGVLNAADESAKPKKGQGPKPGEQVFAVPDTIELSAEQKEKLEGLKKEYGEKAAGLAKQMNEILTAEQKATRKEVTAKAKEEGKKGKELRETVDAALNLTAEQKEKQAKVQKEITALKLEVMGKVLTPEQLKKLTPTPKKKAK